VLMLIPISSLWPFSEHAQKELKMLYGSWELSSWESRIKIFFWINFFLWNFLPIISWEKKDKNFSKKNIHKKVFPSKLICSWTAGRFKTVTFSWFRPRTVFLAFLTSLWRWFIVV
jgi:hypothetical protein